MLRCAVLCCVLCPVSCVQIHNCLCAQIPGFRHGVADAEDACWQLLGELQLLVSSHEEHAYLGRLLDSVADRLPIYTPGPPFKVGFGVC